MAITQFPLFANYFCIQGFSSYLICKNHAKSKSFYFYIGALYKKFQLIFKSRKGF